jgi:dipeptidyl aminopeptidase/acylaminoacyl peptidase
MHREQSLTRQDGRSHGNVPGRWPGAGLPGPNRVLSALIAVLALPVWAACGRAAEPSLEIRHREMVDDVEQAYVDYPSGDLTVTGWLFVHPFSANDVEPCVIFSHGGVSGVGEGLREKCRWLAKQGFIVFAPSYRGEDDSEGEIEVAAGEVDDVVHAVLELQHHPGIVSGQFILLGTSHGALVSIMAHARPELQGLIRGTIAAYGVMDIYNWYTYLVDHGFDVHDPLSRRVYGDGPEDKPEAFARRHALSLVDRLSPAPILLVQGALDEIVPPAQARTMFEALRAEGRTQDRLRIYESGGHGFLFWDDPQERGAEELRDAERAWVDILAFMRDALRESGPRVID